MDLFRISSIVNSCFLFIRRMPIGLQLIGPKYGDLALIEFGKQLIEILK